jgi:hypothetical protein
MAVLLGALECALLSLDSVCFMLVAGAAETIIIHLQTMEFHTAVPVVEEQELIS